MNRDFRELLLELNAYDAENLVDGAHALTTKLWTMPVIIPKKMH